MRDSYRQGTGLYPLNIITVFNEGRCCTDFVQFASSGIQIQRTDIYRRIQIVLTPYDHCRIHHFQRRFFRKSCFQELFQQLQNQLAFFACLTARSHTVRQHHRQLPVIQLQKRIIVAGHMPSVFYHTSHCMRLMIAGVLLEHDVSPLRTDQRPFLSVRPHGTLQSCRHSFCQLFHTNTASVFCTGIAGKLPALILVLKQPWLLYDHAAFSGAIFYLGHHLTMFHRDLIFFICAVFHNICHRIQLLGNNLAILQQTIIPGQIQSCLLKDAHTLLYNRIRIRTILLHLHDDFMIRLSRSLQRLQHIRKIRIHRTLLFLPAHRTLIAVHTQRSGQLVLDSVHLFRRKSFLRTAHSRKNPGKTVK